VSTPAAIEFAGVGRSYGRQRVLDDVTFSVPAGGVSGLLGPNGAGKTTLISILAGFINAEAGTVRVLGHDHRDPWLKGRIGVLPQDAAFQSDLSIHDQLTYLARLAGRGPAQAEREVAAILQRVGLGDWLGRRSTELSHGMHKRLGVAQAFLGDPQVVLLDEPTAGLDPANAQAVRALVREFAGDGGRAVVVSSHDMGEMQELCSHVAILARGRLVSCGPVQELLAARCLLRVLPSRPLAAGERAAIAAEPWCLGVDQTRDGWWEISVSGKDADAELVLQRWLLAQGIAIRHAGVGRSLAEHFLDVTR
jgi:ABC-2 type transport system ATP-binding protein